MIFMRVFLEVMFDVLFGGDRGYIEDDEEY